MVSEAASWSLLVPLSGSLNPCCGGRWSQSENSERCATILRGLNPCCGGRWSQRKDLEANGAPNPVLILVVVEDGLRVSKEDLITLLKANVLILVVVEDGLRGSKDYSRTYQVVLILVVVEDGLRVWSIR